MAVHWLAEVQWKALCLQNAERGVCKLSSVWHGLPYFVKTNLAAIMQTLRCVKGKGCFVILRAKFKISLAEYWNFANYAALLPEDRWITPVLAWHLRHGGEETNITTFCSVATYRRLDSHSAGHRLMAALVEWCALALVSHLAPQPGCRQACSFTLTFARPSQRLRSCKGHGVTQLYEPKWARQKCT